VDAQRQIEAAYRSAREGRVVRVEAAG
jgi:hypothetical protein